MKATHVMVSVATIVLAVLSSTNAADLVSLEHKSHNRIEQLVGVLDLGEVRAGENVETTFRLKNNSNSEIEFSTVKPSCGCTAVRIRAGSLAVGSTHAPAKLRVNVPKLKGHRADLAEVELVGLESHPVATIVIRADVLRPFNVQQMRRSIYVSKDARFQSKIKLNIASFTSRKKLLVNLPKSLTHEIDGDFLIVSGSSKNALKATPVIVEIGYESDTWTIRDHVMLDFYDENAVRISPSTLDRGRDFVRCLIVSKQGINADKFRIVDSKQKDIEFSLQLLSKQMGKIRIDLREVAPGDIVISDGVFSVSCPVVGE